MAIHRSLLATELIPKWLEEFAFSHFAACSCESRVSGRNEEAKPTKPRADRPGTPVQDGAGSEFCAGSLR